MFNINSINPPLGTKLVAVQMVPATWSEFKKLARSREVSSSALLRTLVTDELRRAAKHK
jgi:hypothetical protein